MKQLHKKIVIITIVIFSILLGACSKSERHIYSSTEEINGQNMGCMSGSIFDVTIQEQFPKSEIIYYSSRSELLLGLTSGKIEAFVSDEPVAMMMISQNDAVTYLDEAVGSVEYGICFSNDSKDILKQFNEYLETINNSGHLKELQDKWINPEATSKKKVEYELSGENGTITCVTTPDAAPFSFIADNVFQGYEVEIMNEFCHEYGYDLHIDTVSFDALLTSVATGKYNVALNGIFITPERAKSVNFCTPTYKGRVVVMISNGKESQKKGFIASIKDSFYKNFIEEDRYLLLLKGVLTTFIISFFSIILGSLFGLILYILSVINKVFKKIVDVLAVFLAKLPVVVLLMILFYVVFKSSTIDAIIVSIIGFSYLFGHTFYGLLNVGVASVDIGQSEGAMALGYERWPAFFRIILPQALKTICDTYLNEVIALIKNTSIVGYVSVTDVTRASDIIRGRTYEALFPLIVVAIIYFLLCTVLIALLRLPLKAYIEKKVNYND